MKGTIHERLFKTIDLTQKLFYPEYKKMTFVSEVLEVNYSKFRAYKAGQNQVSFDFVIDCVAKFPMINWNYVMYGEGEPFKKNSSTLIKPQDKDITITELKAQVKDIMFKLEALVGSQAEPETK